MGYQLEVANGWIRSFCESAILKRMQPIYDGITRRVVQPDEHIQPDYWLTRPEGPQLNMGGIKAYSLDSILLVGNCIPSTNIRAVCRRKAPARVELPRSETSDLPQSECLSAPCFPSLSIVRVLLMAMFGQCPAYLLSNTDRSWVSDCWWHHSAVSRRVLSAS